MAHHGSLTASEDIHVINAWSYANAAARTAATGFLSTDVGKIARDLDTNNYFVLTDESPITWLNLGAAHTHALGDLTSVGQIVSPQWVTGRYYDLASMGFATFSSGTYPTGTLIAVLIYVPKSNTVDRIGVGVSSTAAQTARMGIYAMGSDGNPGALIVDAGTVSVALSSAMAEITISAALTGGTWYWLAIEFSGTTGSLFRLVPADSGPIGYATLASASNGAIAVDRAHTFGALPDPFGTPAIRTGHCPRIGLRAG